MTLTGRPPPVPMLFLLGSLGRPHPGCDGTRWREPTGRYGPTGSGPGTDPAGVGPDPAGAGTDLPGPGPTRRGRDRPAGTGTDPSGPGPFDWLRDQPAGTDRGRGEPGDQALIFCFLL